MGKKQVVVIGGTSGVGLEVVKQLILDPETQVLVGSRKTSPEMDGLNWSLCDVTDPLTPFPAAEGPIDGLVYSVGSINLKPFKQLKEADFLADLQLNLLGAIRSIQHYLPQLLAAPAATVVAYSTVAVGQGMTFHASIAAAKGALEGLFRSLAAEFSPKIRFNLIALSLTDTPLGAPLLNTETKKDAAAKRHPLQRVIKPSEIGSLTTFLLGPNSASITGQVFHVDGGLSSVRIFGS